MPEFSIEHALQLALQKHQAGNLVEAERLYRQILSRQGDHAATLHWLGVLTRQTGRIGQAVPLLRRSVELDADSTEAWTHLGDALHAQGKQDEAIEAYRQALDISPHWAEAHGALANALKDRGRLDEAVAAYMQAIRLKPNMPEAHNNMGSALYEQKKFDEAVQCYARAIRLKGDFAEAFNNLGNALSELGRLDEAIASYRKAIHFKPEYPDAYSNLGLALKNRGLIDQAIAAYCKAIEFKPDLVHALTNMAIALKDQSRHDEAIAIYDKAIAFRPDYSEAHNNKANCLKDQGLLDEAIASYRRAMELRPDDPVPHSNFLCTIHFHPDYDAKTIFGHARQWNQRHAVPLASSIRPHDNDPSPKRRLRIGYVSPDFREHPIGRFILPLLEHHDFEDFEIYCYSALPREEALTKRHRAAADVWRDIANVTDEQAAELIRQDRIDILVDLTMHMNRCKLLIFARKPAPVQVTWLAYCSTTGLDAMDYRLTDPHLDPPGRLEYYSEQSIHLPVSNWCYQPCIPTPPPEPLPAMKAGHVTFGCLNNLCKVTKPTLAAWSRLLARVPESRLIMQVMEGSPRQRLHDYFAGQGIDPGRIEFAGFVPAMEYFQTYNRIDITLDPFPYVGGTTTCDALYMGVPVVTLAGKSALGRCGVSMLSNVHLPQFIANSVEQYVDIAARWAADLPSLADLRGGLRAQLERSVLMDAGRYARDVENAYRQMWANWLKARK